MSIGPVGPRVARRGRVRRRGGESVEIKAVRRCGNGYGGWMHGGWAWWGMGLGFLFWIVLAAALVLIIRAAVSPRADQGAGGAAPETPLDVLQKRYARGDISREEYEQKRRDLTDGPR